MKANEKCALILVAAVAAGCGQTRAQQCETLIDRVNQSSTRVSRGIGGEKGKAVLDLVTSIDAAKAEVVALQLLDGKLKEYQASYVKVLETFSAAAKTMPAVATEKDQHAIETGLERIKAASAEESAIVNKINHYCHSDS